MPDNKIKKVEVVLDVYSGRPNPSWTLSAKQIQSLVKLLGKDYRKMTLVRPRTPPGLGYRGFMIINQSKEKSLPPELHVYKGVISFKITNTRNKLAKVQAIEDQNRLEAWLLNLAEKKDLGKLIRESGGPNLKDLR
jgi:hypothetical protein